MASYEFESVWKIRAPLADVWRSILETEEWTKWWPGLDKVEVIAEGDERGIGRRRRLTWAGVGPYKMTFDGTVAEMEPMSLYIGKASGTMEGEGVWRFSEDDGVTTVHYVRRVRTTKLFLNLFSPIVKPIIHASHEKSMHKGATGLAKFLNAELVQG